MRIGSLAAPIPSGTPHRVCFNFGFALLRVDDLISSSVKLCSGGIDGTLNVVLTRFRWLSSDDIELGSVALDRDYYVVEHEEEPPRCGLLTVKALTPHPRTLECKLCNLDSHPSNLGI
ncbi:hypothetical protein AKJ16_DCAP04856 [Drosera capensis]